MKDFGLAGWWGWAVGAGLRVKFAFWDLFFGFLLYQEFGFLY